MKSVTITGNWLNQQHPEHYRAQLVKNIFSLASAHDWDIRMSGEHWA